MANIPANPPIAITSWSRHHVPTDQQALSRKNPALSIHIAQTGRHAVLAIQGRFVFEMRSEFLEAMRRVTSLPDCDDISVDLSATEYLDSSAIGMLLILRDRALDAGRQTRITGSAGNVRNVLAMCNIGQLIPLD